MAPGGVRFSSVGPFHPPATLHNLSLALFTSTLIHIFIADPLSCKAYHQHIEGSSTLSADLQSVDETWWAEGKQLLLQQQSLCWAFLSSEMQHWDCIFEWERKREGGEGLYIGNLMLGQATFGEKKIPQRPTTSEQATHTTVDFSTSWWHLYRIWFLILFVLFS